MKLQQRIIALMLVLVISISIIPVQALAETTGQDASVDAGDLAIQGTNSFGALLSEEINQYQDETESAYETGYTVTDLVIEGNEATVTYDTLEKAVLVVALYSEDGLQLITSGSAAVVPEETTAVIAIEGDMPEYFLASAYLLDTYDLSPLCAAYDTPMYTKEMQELLASTVHDYDPDRVLNLDDDDTTNFAVFAEDVIQLTSSDTTNIVISADHETMEYVIGNVDETVTGLKENDIFVLSYGVDNLLIAKVSSVKLDGTTATIVGADLEMEEVFQVAKIEGKSSTADVVVDESTADEGITYKGLVENDGPAAYAHEGDYSKNVSQEYDISLSITASDSDVTSSVAVKGTLLLEVEASVNYYISLTQQFLEFRVTPKSTLTVNVTGKVDAKKSLPDLGIYVVPSVFVGLTPEIQLKFEGEAEARITVQATMGVGYRTGSGIQNLSSAPKTDVYLSVEGTIFFGIDFHPNVTIMDFVAKIELTTLVGLELNAKMKGTNFEEQQSNAENLHQCKNCLSADLNFKAEIEGKLTFLEIDALSFPVEIGKFSVPLGSLYYSFDNDTFDFGECPNYTYRVTVEVLDKDGQPVKNQNVTVSTQASPLVTNQYGVVCFYTPAATIQVSAEKDGYSDSDKAAISAARKIQLKLTKQGASGTGSGKDNWVFGTVDSDQVLDQSTIIASGQAGDNITWTLYGSGRMVFRGYGTMKSFSEHSKRPWYEYREQIRSVEIQEGITNIAYLSFNSCVNLESVSIPGTVVSIDKSAFENCYSLKHIVVPEGVKEIGMTAFFGCRSLTTITLPSTLEKVGYYAFIYSSASGYTDLYYGGTPEQFNQIDFIYIYDCYWLIGATIHYNSAGPGEAAAAVSAEGPVLFSIYPGEYDTEVEETRILKTASFTGLIPGQDYVLLSLADLEAEDPIGAENLLYIDQAPAADDGTLVFRYVQRTPTAVSYVMACGPSDKNLADATIIFPEMTADGELQTVNPIVVYDGQTLTEGTDYTLVGTVSFTRSGEYTCFIRGIRDYTGLVACSYTVAAGASETLTGSIRLKSGTLNLLDKVCIIYYCCDDQIATNNADVAERGVMLFASRELAATKNPDLADEVIDDLVYDEAESTKAGYAVYAGQSEGIDARDMDKSQFAVAYVKMTDGTYYYSTKNGVEQIIEYSPLIYCKKKINDTTVVGNLCRAMMHYGAAAQVEQYKMTTGLMNEGFAAVEYDASVLGESVFSVNANVINGLKLNSATMDLKGAISYIVEFTPSGDAEGKELYAEYNLLGKTESVKLETSTTAGRLSATISGVPAKDLGATLKVKAYYLDANGEKVYGGELVYSGYEYIRRGLDNSKFTAEVKALCRAMAMYIYYADAYGN